MQSFSDQVFYKSSEHMSEIPDSSVQVIITSPPYFNIKDYSKDGYQTCSHSEKKMRRYGSICQF